MKLIIPRYYLGGYEKEKKKFRQSEKFLAGCQALGGKSVKEISDEKGMSREYVYQQKDKVDKYVQELDERESRTAKLILDERNKKRIILSLSLDCHASAEGIRRFFESVCNESVSAGYVSHVLKEASKRAQEFDDQIDLSGIRQGANDEIFQCGTPVLTGIDPESTYTYLLEEACNRTAETWETYLEERKDHGLDLNTSINDSGTGLMAGVSRAYPRAEIQADTFHALRSLGREISKIERRSYSLIKDEYAIIENLKSKRPRKKNKEALKEVQVKTAANIELYDVLFILFTWLKEMLGFSGYNMEDSLLLTADILEEMQRLAADFPSLQKEVRKVRKLLPSLLLFIKQLERGMAERAKETGLPLEAFQLMYHQRTYGSVGVPDNESQRKLVYLLMERYTEAEDELQGLLNKTKKASSLVENLNGRIRLYMEVKRMVPARFFVLLKVFFNTRRYYRSRCKERVGKSPLELLTGTPQPDFFEALGY